MTVNTRLLENPALQRMPKNEREWVQYQNELAQWVRNIVRLGDGSITTAGGTTISGLDEMPGTLAGGESLPTVNAFNKSSVQSTSTLTSSDGGGTATISIAAHSIYYDNGSVSYNAGSVTGLAFSTKYYVYADDASKAGGAVTYIATTTSTDVVSASGRYYLGSITTGVVGAAKAISGITKGSPTTFITPAAHDFTSGATVNIASIVDDGPGGDIESTFNGNGYVITVTTTTQFTVAVDSSSLTNVWASGGTATQVASSPSGGYGGGGGFGGGEIP